MTENESPFACDMTAIAPDQRATHMAAIKSLFNSVEGVRELSGGYAFHVPNESDTLIALGQFIALERLCCPFLGFAVDVEREGGAVWFSLTGREGVKPFIMAEIGDHLPKSLNYET